MKKIGYAVAALGALALALPSIASAETVVIKRHHYHPFDARAEYRVHRDYGFHEGWRHRDRGVVVERRHDTY
ncbi:hypothetical protein [Bradyrhizobium sp. Tv2a-2]|uniref:hypothetical protein n=1 Tax=Bradyrhizobium sp. Tv2a-2 TaxID=113395 RepID=UPI000418EAC6|nr:hypothetical protein [Bradyrhizobium sp. Tv2a-2]